MIRYENKTFYYDRPKTSIIKELIKNVLNIIDRFFYTVVFFFYRPRRKPNKYNVSICAIFKDEAPYLKEWIEFHKIIGIDHFYLYNNFSGDEYLKVLNPYIKEGTVTLIDWPYKQAQLEAYQDFFKKFRFETKWVGFIDIDEFVIPKKYDNIYDFLQKFDNKPSVIIYWKIFGTSGLMERPINNLVIEDFYLGYQKYSDIGKVFFNTKYEYNPNSRYRNTVHIMCSKNKVFDLPAVNVFNKICTFGINPTKNTEMPIQINHYLLKSYNEYIELKSKRGGGVHDISMHNLDYFFMHEKMSYAFDHSAYKFLEQIKSKINK